MIIASTTLVNSSNSAEVNTSNINAQLALGHTIDFSNHNTGGIINQITMNHPDCAIIGNRIGDFALYGVDFLNGVRIADVTLGREVAILNGADATKLVVDNIGVRVFAWPLSNTRGLIIENIVGSAGVAVGAFFGTTIRNCYITNSAFGYINGSDNIIHDNFCDAQFYHTNCLKFFPAAGGGSCRNNKVYNNTFLGSLEENTSYDGWQSGSCMYEGYVGSTIGSTIRVHTIRSTVGIDIYSWDSVDLLICEGEHRTKHFPLVTIRKDGVEITRTGTSNITISSIGDYATGIGNLEIYYEIDVDGDLPELVPGTFIQIVAMFIGNEIYNNYIGDSYVPDPPADANGFLPTQFCIPNTRTPRGGTDYYGGAPIALSFGCIDNHIHHNTLVCRQFFAAGMAPTIMSAVLLASLSSGNGVSGRVSVNLCHNNIIEYNDITARFPLKMEFLTGIRNPYWIEGFYAYTWYDTYSDWYWNWFVEDGPVPIPALEPFMPIDNGYGNCWNMHNTVAEVLSHPFEDPVSPRSSLKLYRPEGNVFRYNIIRDTIQLYQDAEPVSIYDRFPDHAIYTSDGEVAIYGNSNNIPIISYNVHNTAISPKHYGRHAFEDFSTAVVTQPTRTGLRAESSNKFDLVELKNDSGEDIRYTLGVNPDDPTIDSTLYAAPINLYPGKTTIKATTFVNGVQGETITENYDLPPYQLRASLSTTDTETISNPLSVLAGGPWDQEWTKYGTVTMFNPGESCWALVTVRKWIGWERVIKIPHGEFQVDLCSIPNVVTPGAWWEDIPNALVPDIWHFAVVIPSPVHTHNTKIYRINYPNTVQLQLSSNIISFISPDYVLPRNPDGSLPFDLLINNFVENP